MIKDIFKDILRHTVLGFIEMVKISGDEGTTTIGGHGRR